MDLDLGQVRAFVAAAEQHGFGRAADQLHVTQQALSKRVARLESSLGSLFVRQPGGVALTARGMRFLPAARDLLAAAEAAVASARDEGTRPLRVDVWGHLHPPYARVQDFARAHPALVVETSMRRSLPLALTALRRRELDAALGNVSGLDGPLPSWLRSELVATTPLVALLNREHPLADRVRLTRDDLRQHRLSWPTEPGSPELDRFATGFARALGLHLCTEGRNLGLEALLEGVRTDPSRITVVGSQWPLPSDEVFRLVPITPTPHYPWHLVWPATAAHPALPALQEHLRASAELPDAGSDDVWLPQPELRKE